jgi:membrane-bound lytic murein transglycosylase D
MAGKVIRALVFVVAAAALTGGPVFAAADYIFPRPASVEPNIKFWVDVFSGYGERDFVIHDRDHLWRIYQVMHVPGDGLPTRAEADGISDYLKIKYAGILNHLATGQPPSSPEERRVALLFKGEPLSAYSAAAQNLRVQQGMRERFQEGILRSRYYRSTMERIFSAAGLPPELVTLAEIESGFYTRARSSAGAVGIWQFTRDTGREYMHISRYHDDRLSPIASTAAAAKLLRANYETLGSWPLAITAYNYGTGGMAEASSEYHGDYSKIVQNYAGSRFGFASKNYYPEFLAALQIHRYEDSYFPGLKYAETPPLQVVQTNFAPPHRSVKRRLAVRHVIAHPTHHARKHHREVASAQSTHPRSSGRGRGEIATTRVRSHSHALRSAERIGLSDLGPRAD